jgi:hypothetical protein
MKGLGITMLLTEFSVFKMFIQFFGKAFLRILNSDIQKNQIHVVYIFFIFKFLEENKLKMFRWKLSHFIIPNKVYYIRLYFTVFLLARSNTRDIPFSNILISKKQFLCNKKSYCTLVQNQSLFCIHN